MSQQDSLLGKQLDEYKLEKLLGQGGMARVYRAIDTKLRRYVAIKVIDAQFRTDEEYARRFELEAQAIARFDHPHVVTLHRYGTVDGLLYMAMQYVKGSDLAQLLDEYRADDEFMTAEEVLRIMQEAGRGLDYVHQQGTIHRDIKPSNIMLKEDGTAIIADFGLVLLEDIGTRGEIFGTPHYMSPEQALSSAKVVPQSDVYSMGVILYEMLTHYLPFQTGSPLDIAMAHMSEEPPAPRTYRHDLPEAIEAVILKSLKKDAQDRYQSCRELTDALEIAIKQSKITHQTTMPRHSIIERVQLDLEANPLPPLPPSTAQMPAAKSPEPSLLGQMSTQETAQAMTELAQHTAEPTVPSTHKSDNNKRSMLPFAAAGGLAVLAIIVVLFLLNSGRESNAEATNTAVAATNAAVVLQLTETNNATSDDSLPITQQALNAQETAIADANATGTAIIAQAQQSTDNESTQQALNRQETAIVNAIGTSTAIVVQAQAENNQVTQQSADIQATGVALNMTSTAVANQQATSIAQLTQSASVVVQPNLVVIMIYTNKDRALRIVRPVSSVTTPLDLAPLLLIRADDDVRLHDTNANNNPANPRQLQGTVWTPLLAGGCVDALRNSNQTPLTDGEACTEQSTYVTVDNENKAWDKEFNVYYQGVLLGMCENGTECRIEVPIGG